MCSHLSRCIVSASIGFAIASNAIAQVMRAAPTNLTRTKTAGPAMAKEPISAERLEALQRPKYAGSLGIDHGTSPKLAANTKQQTTNSPQLMLDRVLFDEPGDGSMWAVGSTYKASFTPAGFTYIPRFGPNAPRNFPIAFALEEVTVGGRPLSLDAAAPTRQDNRVTFNRGAIKESYDLALNSVEQTFTLNDRPGPGDLVLRMSVQTELNATQGENRFTFTHDLGTVAYSRAVVVDAASRRTEVATRLAAGASPEAAMPGSLDAMAIEIELPASLLADAAYPIVIDPVIATNTVESGFDDRYPDTAYDNFDETFRVVFEEQYSATDGDIYSYRIDSTTGAVILGSLTTIDSTTFNWRRPKISCSVSTYMIVAEAGFAPSRVIRGRTCSSTSNATGSQFTIGDTVNYPGDETHVDIGGLPYGPGGDGMLYVVWQNEYSATDHDILARALRSGGAFYTGVLEVDYSTNDDINPAISESGLGIHAVAWERIYSPSDHDIYGAGIEYDGPIVVYPTFAVDTTGVDNRNPRVTSNMGDLASGYLYAYAYEEAPATAADIYTRVMQLAPKIGTAAVFAQANVTAMDGVLFETRAPVVEGDSWYDRFTIAYEELYHGVVNDWDAYASSFCFAEASITQSERHRRIAFTLADDSHLMAASKSAFSGSNEVLVVWGELFGGFGDIWNARYDFPATCCAWDVNHDGVTNIDDLLAVISAWGPCDNCNADITGNSVVNIDDLLAVINGWGACP